MKKLRFVLIVAILLAVVIPFTVQAAGTFYCTASSSNTGAGTFANPWGCSTQQELDYVINTLICGQYGGGVLYRLFPTSYVFYDIVYTVGAGCTIRFQAEYPGRPPRTGVNLPAPLIASLAVAGALVIGGVGLVLRRKPA
jgi:hypothetical protein